MLSEMDEQEEMKTVSSSDESEETDEEVEMERMAQHALMEKEKVSLIWCKMKTWLNGQCKVDASLQNQNFFFIFLIFFIQTIFILYIRFLKAQSLSRELM